MNIPKPPHDPQKLLADFRDHLARHDKPLAFLFGAGTSCAVRAPDPDDPATTRPLIPAVNDLTLICKEHSMKLGKKYARAWDAIESHCTQLGQSPNAENMLSRLRMMRRTVIGKETLSGLRHKDIDRLEATVRKTIARVVSPDLSTLTSNSPHRQFARWLLKRSRANPVEIFTVNYDVLFEHALEAERLPVFDGFVGSYRPFFHADSVRRKESAPGSNWIRLWKMHGSVTWRRIEQDDGTRIVRQDPNDGGEMIYPSFEKYDESRQLPYSAFTDRLSRFLEQDDALLIVAGFSFGDEHINNILFGTLENRPRTHVYALQYEELKDGDHLVKRSRHRLNLVVCGPQTGIIAGRRSNWKPVEVPSFMDVAFELVSEPALEADEKSTSELPTGPEPGVVMAETAVVSQEGSRSGRMKIGDFCSLCEFLDTMTLR